MFQSCFNTPSHMINTQAPPDPGAYLVDDFLSGAGAPSGNWLLDGDGVPFPDPINRSVAGLAALAAAIHKHAAAMEPVHLEKAIWWLKDWKMHKSPPPWRTPQDFHLEMERLKQTTRKHKPDDHLYFLQCLRLARCTSDLLDAGLFAPLPADSKTFESEDDVWKAVRQMQRQLADALYCDDDLVLRYAFSDKEKAEARAAAAANWPRRSLRQP